MPRYIDANALKRKAQKVATEAWKMKLTAKVETTLNQFIDWIDEMPTAQPEIIRCGECKYYGRADKRRFYRGMDCLNEHIATIVPDRDFCSYAERRTDE